MTNDQKFEKYYELLTEWNEKINLTTITERERVYLLHFNDSILYEDLIEKDATVIDIGSGAGFPGIPLKIVRDDLDVTLLDSVNKKVTFMNEVIRELDLKGIKAVHKRAEEVREKFDVVVSRAIAPLNTVVEYSLPLTKIGGKTIAYKSTDKERELEEAEKAIKLLGGEIETVDKRRLSDDIIRWGVVIKKIKETPSGYPRGGNKPRVKPIL